MSKRKKIKIFSKKSFLKKKSFWRSVWKTTGWTSLVVVSASAINQGLVGVSSLNLVASLKYAWLIKTSFVLVGISGVVLPVWVIKKLSKKRK